MILKNIKKIFEKKPDDLQVSTWVEDNKVILQECLLNQDDSITLRILATKIESDIKVEGRIVGGGGRGNR